MQPAVLRLAARLVGFDKVVHLINGLGSGDDGEVRLSFQELPRHGDTMLFQKLFEAFVIFSEWPLVFTITDDKVKWRKFLGHFFNKARRRGVSKMLSGDR